MEWHVVDLEPGEEECGLWYTFRSDTAHGPAIKTLHSPPSGDRVPVCEDCLGEFYLDLQELAASRRLGF